MNKNYRRNEFCHLLSDLWMKLSRFLAEYCYEVLIFAGAMNYATLKDDTSRNLWCLPVNFSLLPRRGAFQVWCRAFFDGAWKKSMPFFVCVEKKKASTWTNTYVKQVAFVDSPPLLQLDRVLRVSQSAKGVLCVKKVPKILWKLWQTQPFFAS